MLKVGDRVRVRRWRDMENQYEKTNFGDLKVPFSFTSMMEPYCGETFRVASIYSIDANEIVIKLDEEQDYVFSLEMFEDPITGAAISEALVR